MEEGFIQTVFNRSGSGRADFDGQPATPEVTAARVRDRDVLALPLGAIHRAREVTMLLAAVRA
jgi:hypothetical protein